MTPDPRLLIIVILLLVVVLVGRRMPKRLGELSDALGSGRALPVAAAILTGAITLWVWGGLRAVPVIHDEVAYVLQAELFSRGLWSLPSPPLPDAFAQAAVLVTPVLAPKMPPGHALALSPGVMLGLPGFMPVLLVAITGGLIVALARRVTSPAVALLTLAVWLTQAGQMRWRASYMSQATSGVLWIFGWWCLWRWRETRRTSWLLALAAAAGVGAVTRPLTMLAWAIPVGVVVLYDVIRLRQWKGLAAAIAVGTACLLIMPVQNQATLGDWRKSPLTLYTRQYIPFDVMGFGLDSTRPSIEGPADFRRAMAGLSEVHRNHTVGNLPVTLFTRLNVLRQQSTGQWRLVWIPALLIGVFVLTGPGWFALVTGLGLYLAYLLYAHEPQWTAYYAEMTPAVALLCAVGLAWGLSRLSGIKSLPTSGALAGALCILGVGGTDFRNSRISRAGAQAPYRRFMQQVAATGAPRSLVFVRTDPSADPHLSFVRNVADRDRAEVLTAYDVGPARNDSIASAFPRRAPFLWDQETGRLTPLRRTDPR